MPFLHGQGPRYAPPEPVTFACAGFHPPGARKNCDIYDSDATNALSMSDFLTFLR